MNANSQKNLKLSGAQILEHLSSPTNTRKRKKKKTTDRLAAAEQKNT
jgi:hypothetical protein